MFTASAARSLPESPDDPRWTVQPPARLYAAGHTADSVATQVRARRWQRFGRTVLLHNGPPSLAERRRIVLLNCGRRAAPAAFSAAEELGLQGWEREAVHVIVPGGTHVRRVAGISTRIHYASTWDERQAWTQRRTFRRPRPAIGIMAAGVQQRFTTARDLRAVIDGAARLTHRRNLLLALDDIEQGAQALSEIDFVRLCRKAGLPPPRQQAVRPDRHGRRRYLDAEWVTSGGRRLVAEVDGALHLIAQRWWEDQLRQTEIVLTDRIVLRFPSVVVRLEEPPVLDQLTRGLAL